ncbi:VIT1/CCC1 transporter family protein [Candidatus Uhrbacteria bacterium]|nr:VIT1/CCC1 transporter family protein [Candidatus Uhrbacteria bacterium]
MQKYPLERLAATSIREIVFGLEDSLVSTLGAVTGIAAGTHDPRIVILSGLVLVAVEATSMSAGSYLSSESAAEVEAVATHRSSRLTLRREAPLRSAFVMAVFYMAGGALPLLPYVLLPLPSAFLPSVLLTVTALFALGWWIGRLTKRNPWKRACEMVVVSLTAAVIGYLIGRFASSVLHVDVQA